MASAGGELYKEEEGCGLGQGVRAAGLEGVGDMEYVDQLYELQAKYTRESQLRALEVERSFEAIRTAHKRQTSAGILETEEKAMQEGRVQLATKGKLKPATNDLDAEDSFWEFRRSWHKAT